MGIRVQKCKVCEAENRIGFAEEQTVSTEYIESHLLGIRVISQHWQCRDCQAVYVDAEQCANNLESLKEIARGW